MMECLLAVGHCLGIADRPAGAIELLPVWRTRRGRGHARIHDGGGVQVLLCGDA